MSVRADTLALTQPYGIGRGTVETFTVTTPAAGAQFSRTTAQGYWERVISMFFLFTTSAVVASRQVALEVQDADGNVIGGEAAPQLQAASLVGRYYVKNTTGSIGFAGPLRQSLAFPGLFLQPGWKVVTNVSLIDVTDTLTLVRGVVERFGIGQDGTPVGETRREDTKRDRHYERNLEGM